MTSAGMYEMAGLDDNSSRQSGTAVFVINDSFESSDEDAEKGDNMMGNAESHFCNLLDNGSRISGIGLKNDSNSHESSLFKITTMNPIVEEDHCDDSRDTKTSSTMWTPHGQSFSDSLIHLN